jgi:hypothetical protein
MSYEMIDRFLRNNLGDDDYAEYSAALDSLCTPQQRKPLTDEQKKNIFLKFYGKHWSYTKQIQDVMDAVEAAHGIKE